MNKNNDNSFSDFLFLGKLVLLVAFFIFALVFIYKSVGFTGFITFIGFCALFTPLFLTKPATFVERNDPFLDPVNKGWLGNIFTRK